MKLLKIFKNDIKREIPPVIFFHEQDGEKIAAEVSEYIITGGWPEDHPNYQRVSNGIHEQYVRLLKNMAAGLSQQETLPAAWISGFYGSGKSLFSKILGLALDGMVLPSGEKLEDAWLVRNSSPRRDEMIDAWKQLRQSIDPIAVVFDIGGSAKGDEQVSSVVLRNVQEKLNYCQRFPNVARYELRLEKDGSWDKFLALCQEELEMSWKEAQKDVWADENFSLLMHKLHPKVYPDSTTWLDTWGGKDLPATSAKEIVEDICAMMQLRAPGKHLFIVVDEVSQYIHQSESKMLSLQSFVSELGAKLRGQVWLMVTGQEKLEETSTNKVLGKLKDRFPPKFRVHLNPSNIRDVVHKRLLEKTEASKGNLRKLFETNRANLKLYAYGCQEATIEEFIEVYPMLPGQIDLLMEITSEIRVRSDRAQVDAQAIRGLMQMLGELFQETDLGEQKLGVLISLDQFFDLQFSSLSSEMQESLSRIFTDYARESDPLLVRVVKVVALLSMVNEKYPTTAELIAQCLYNRVDLGDQQQQVEEILAKLTRENAVGHSAKYGYSIHSSAAQEWQRERDRKGVSVNQIAQTIQQHLGAMLADSQRPKLFNRPIDYRACYIDPSIREESIIDSKSQRNTRFHLDLYYISECDSKNTEWINRSHDKENHDRILWVAHSSSNLEELARKYIRSVEMCTEYQARMESLTHSQRLCVISEDSRREELDRELRNAVEQCWMEGKIYFRGREIDPHAKGRNFKDTFLFTTESVLHDIFPHMKKMRVDRSELSQFLEKDLSGISPKFMTEGEGERLGIFTLEDSNYVPSCGGEVPNQIGKYIQSKGGIAGGSLVDEFERPPYGYEEAMILACVAGLLRAERIYILDNASKQEIRHFRDPGARNIFERQRDFRRATIYVAQESEINPKDRNKICRFFKTRLNAKVEKENGAIADAAESRFPELLQNLEQLKARLQKLPGKQRIPDELHKLGEALTTCIQKLRDTQKTVSLIKNNLDTLNDGVVKLRELDTELTDDAVESVLEIENTLNTYVAQLAADNALSEEQQQKVQEMGNHLQMEKPWLDCHVYQDDLLDFRECYRQRRIKKLGDQQRKVNESLQKIRMRKGFDKLDSQKQNRIVEVISNTKTATTEKQTKPTLSELEGTFIVELQQAMERANDMLDQMLAEETEVPIVQVKIDLGNQEIETEEQLDQMLADLKERAMEQINTGCRIRFVN